MAIVLFVVCTAVALLGGIFLWVLVFNSPDAERYLKQRMQGPFVPVHPDVVQEQSESKKK